MPFHDQNDIPLENQ